MGFLMAHSTGGFLDFSRDSLIKHFDVETESWRPLKMGGAYPSCVLNESEMMITGLVNVPMFHITQPSGIQSPTDIWRWCSKSPTIGTFTNPWITQFILRFSTFWKHRLFILQSYWDTGPWFFFTEFNPSDHGNHYWLVVWTPQKNISQLGWLATQYMGK